MFISLQYREDVIKRSKLFGEAESQEKDKEEMNWFPALASVVDKATDCLHLSCLYQAKFLDGT